MNKDNLTIEEIKGLLKEISPYPWHVEEEWDFQEFLGRWLVDKDGKVMGEDDAIANKLDADFIAAAPSIVNGLLAQLEERERIASYHKEEAEQYQNVLEDALHWLCEAININPERYDTDQSDYECYRDLFRDVKKLLICGKWKFDEDECVFESQKDKVIEAAKDYFEYKRNYRNHVKKKTEKPSLLNWEQAECAVDTILGVKLREFNEALNNLEKQE